MRSKLFERQFVISDGRRSVPEGAVRHALSTLHVDVFPGLPVVEIRDAADVMVGLALGTVIDADRQEMAGPIITLDVVAGHAPDLNNLVERNLYRFCGSFIFVFDALGERRIYLDANGSLSVVYDPEARSAGATSAVLLGPDEYTRRFQSDLYSAFDVAKDGWFTAGLTAHRGIRRLLCNHFLDLNVMQAVRHWPRDAIPAAPDADGAIGQICDNVTKTLGALLKSEKVVVALTAGNETRLLVACCREFIDQVRFVTVDAPGAQTDREIASLLSAKFNLLHEVLPYHRANKAQAEAWRSRVGHSVSGANVYLHPSVAPLEDKYFVGGLGGEIGRGFLWLDADGSTQVDARSIVARLKLPQHPAIVAAVDEWLGPVAHYDPLFILDLAYMELRMSAWAFAQSYATPKPVELHPLISRANYTAMLSLPPSLRKQSGMIRRGIELRWAELLSVPINKFGDWRDNVSALRHALMRPDRAIRKLRQVLTS